MKGSSTVVELIAIAAAVKELEEETYGRRKSMVRALDKAIEMITKIDSMKLAYQEVSKNKWARVPEAKLNSSGYSSFVPNVIGTSDIFHRKCYMIDPANPFNDLLGEQKQYVLDKLKTYAGVTKERLMKLTRGDYTKIDPASRMVEVDLLKLFEPQPSNLKTLYPDDIPIYPGGSLQVSSWWPCSNLHCDKKVRNEEVMKRRGVRLVIETVTWNILATAKTILHMEGEQLNHSKSQAVSTGVERLIELNFGVTLCQAARDHEEMDVTVVVPYGNGYGAKLSMRFKE